MIARKPPILVTIALANRMARIAWALMTRGGNDEALGIQIAAALRRRPGYCAPDPVRRTARLTLDFTLMLGSSAQI